jgi:SM-20-related protein
MSLRALDLDALKAAPLTREPFQHLVVPGFVRAQARAEINADYPKISEGGSFPAAQLSYGPAFKEFLDELESDEFREAFEQKFGLELDGRPTTITVRGQCSPKDGRIHTDTKSKIITILIYMNPAWENSGGRLRLLKSADNLDDMIMEVPPVEGTLLAFKRADNSWHGHKPFAGERRVIQFNWVTSEGDRRLAMLRHQVSAPFKRLIAAMRPSAA